jgi:hypothetical protein
MTSEPPRRRALLSVAPYDPAPAPADTRFDVAERPRVRWQRGGSR